MTTEQKLEALAEAAQAATDAGHASAAIRWWNTAYRVRTLLAEAAEMAREADLNEYGRRTYFAGEATRLGAEARRLLDEVAT